MDRHPSQPTIAAWTSLVRASVHVIRQIELELKTAGYPPLAWYDVLLEVKQAEAGLRPGELEARLLLEQHNVSRLIDRMEAKGLVRRQKCEEDGRGQLITITEDGRAMQRKMWPVYRAAIQRHVGSKLSGVDIARLAILLRQLL